MGNFVYVAKSRAGAEETGLLAATDVDEVVGHLHGKGLVVLHVAEQKRRTQEAGLRASFALSAFGKAGNREVALFTRQFATVMNAGIPIVRGLRGLAADTPNRTLARAIQDVATRIEGGESLSEAMAAHPEAFNGMYVSMVRAGERAGTLDEILEHVAVYLEKTDAIRAKVRSAMSYPVFVLAFALFATAFLLFKIVPTFADIYASFGQKLPRLTMLVVGASNAIRSHVWLSAGIALALAIGVALFLRTPGGRRTWHRLQIGVPIFGPIVRKAVMSRFARTFGVLIHSGLPVLEAMELTKATAGNVVVSGAIERARTLVAAGHGITESFRSTGEIPEMVLQLMATGEESGELDTMLMKASDFYDRQVEASVQGLTALIEPVLIVFVGAVIGIVVVSMFLPIFYLGDAIMKGGYSY
ncbi:MAG: type II secretion system F family protein [Candidatus Eisenbacteria bacterium]|nr:type II secretion system F family protein [Candidatus Eisenbacteria bacterium]